MEDSEYYTASLNIQEEKLKTAKKYSDVFGTPVGKDVLQDIKRYCLIGVPKPLEVEPLNRVVGREEVYQHIENNLNLKEK